jgi:hypothetical protein
MELMIKAVARQFTRERELSNAGEHELERKSISAGTLVFIFAASETIVHTSHH